MQTDQCALTDELLPLYTEGLLAPHTRRRIDEHAAQCPACRARLDRAAATLAPDPAAAAARDKRGWHLSARIQRVLLFSLVSIVILLIGIGGRRYAADRTSPSLRELIPARVADAEQVAARAIPGWVRAKASGLVVDLGVTRKIPGTDATITLEQAWYSGRQAYMLYTVAAPKGGYVMPTRGSLGDAGSPDPWTEGDTDWSHLNQWGGFSSAGFHGVIVFPQLSPPADLQQLKVTVMQWAPVTPEAGLDQAHNPGSQVSLLLPWRTTYLEEPRPDGRGGHREQAWLGRKLIVEDLEVGIGYTRLTGLIFLPEGEAKPALFADLQVGEQTLNMKEFKAEPITDGALWWQFAATFDGPNQWPAPVKIAIRGIGFETDRTLEWPVNWAMYRDVADANRRLMDPADQVSVPFYDSQLISIVASHSGVAFEQKEPTGAPPYVRSAIGAGAGRGPRGDRPGMEVVNSQGEVLTNFGGSVGPVYGNSQGHDQRQGFAARWWDQLPENFRQSDRLVLRYIHPSATLVLNESWELFAPDTAR